VAASHGAAGVKARRKARADWLALMPNAHEPKRSSSPESAGGELFDIIGYVADKFASGRPPGG